MSLGKCIPDMVKRGEIDAARGKRMAELFDELEGFYRRTMGPDAAAAEASEATLKQLRREARLKKRQVVLQATRQRAAAADMARFKGDNRYDAFRALLDDDDRAPYRDGNVAHRARGIEKQVQAMNVEFIEKHRRNLLGKASDSEGLDDIGRELFGDATGNERAKVARDAIEASREYLRQRFNQAGGDIRKLDNYGLRMDWETTRLRGSTPARFADVMLAEADRSQMIDDRTGAPFTDEALRDLALQSFETLRTNGLSKSEPSGAFTGGGKLANRHQEHRVWHFKDFDAWKRVHDEFGSPADIFGNIMGQFSARAREIAMMERLGPNPDATVRLLLDTIEHEQVKSGKVFVPEVSGRSVERRSAEYLWRYVKGEVSGEHTYAHWFPRGVVKTIQGTRNVITSAWLGSASLSSISDVHTQAMARGFYGLPETNWLTQTLASLRDNAGQISAENRKAAARLALGMEDAAHSLGESARFIGEINGPGWTQVLADDVLRLSGLNRLTENRKSAFGQALLGALGDVRHLDWDGLPDAMRTAMERNGLDKFDWLNIRRSEPAVIRGSEFIDPMEVRDQASQSRLIDMVTRGQAMAVQEASMSSRALASFGTVPGTIGGEAIKSAMQFKGFAVALMLKHIRIMQMLGPVKGSIYAARFFIGMTVFGAAVIQLRELAKGNDPRPMDNGDFWGDAALQGGGIGVLGDLVGVFSSDRIDSLGQFIGGPIYGALQDSRGAVRTALPGKERQDGTHRDANPGGGAIRMVKRYTPGSNIWYLRAAWERMVIDSLQGEFDPTVDAGRARAAKRLKDNRQGAWWEAGDALPTRMPDFGNVMGGDQPP